MQKKVREFITHPYPKDSYFDVLQTFLKKRHAKGLSEHTIARLYYNLYPIGKKLDNSPVNELTYSWLKQYVNQQ